MDLDPRILLINVYAAALARAHGEVAVRRALDAEEFSSPVALVAIGKAAQAMAVGAASVLGDHLSDGLVISKAGHLVPSALEHWGLQGFEGGHPVPDAGSVAAGRALVDFLVGLPRDREILFLLSGGASSLLEVLPEGIELDDLRRANEWLLGSGMAINEVNAVRKGLSLSKAGGLWRWIGARRVRALAISDVPGDDPAVIGSGPLVWDSSLAEYLGILELPAWLRSFVTRGLEQRGPTRLEGDLDLRIVADSGLAQRAAVDRGQAFGLVVEHHDEPLSGDAASAGRMVAACLEDGPQGLHVWGGETTVRLAPSPGRGGRNQHLALAAALALTDRRGMYVLAAGTDGTDGPTLDAGALVDGETVRRGAGAGFDVSKELTACNSGPVLEASGDLIRTGPTGTNVMDLVLALNMPSAAGATG